MYMKKNIGRMAMSLCVSIRMLLLFVAVGSMLTASSSKSKMAFVKE